jgi:RNA polymerase sigma-B factor
MSAPSCWDEGDLAELFDEYRRTGSRATRNALVEAHRGLAASIANDYRDRGVDLDDLVQIAMLGVLKAVERYEPERGIPFSSFASRTINGEIKRYFRDRTWAVRPPRSAQERHLDLRRASAALTARHGRPPTVTDLARELNASVDEVLETMETGAAYRATSLDARRPGDDEGLTLGERLPSDEGTTRRAELRVLVGQLLSSLSPRDAEILRLRFYEERTQTEIAERVGISQMHVSRLIRRCLLELREMVD